MGYRANLHEKIGDFPAFLMHGLDLRPAKKGDWIFIPRVEEHIEYVT